MIIEKNVVVSLHYKLQEDNAAGALIEETFGSEPMVFLFGTGQMIPEFERQLAGKKTGDPFAFGIQSADAYGEFDPEAMAILPLSSFVIDGKLETEMLVPGRQIPMSDNEGNRLIGTIMEVKEEGVVLDFNHPMAGQNLYFTGKIEYLRRAELSEIAHGHVHGPGGAHD